jgi:hypothetical protein
MTVFDPTIQQDGDEPTVVAAEPDTKYRRGR